MYALASVIDSSGEKVATCKTLHFTPSGQDEVSAHLTWSEEELGGKVDLWWPIGHGKQKLYDVVVELKTAVSHSLS
jgi:hypothetical protein